MGEVATYSQAAMAGCLASLLLVAGSDHAACPPRQNLMQARSAEIALVVYMAAEQLIAPDSLWRINRTIAFSHLRRLLPRVLAGVVRMSARTAALPRFRGVDIHH